MENTLRKLKTLGIIDLRYKIFFFILLLGTTSAKSTAITPKPANTVAASGEFIFSQATTISVPDSDDDSVFKIANQLAENFALAAGFRPAISHNDSNAAIRLKTNSSLETEEYKLTVTNTKIDIEASQPAGFFYAVQSLRQMLPAQLSGGTGSHNITKWAVSAVTISDKPRFGWRGFMLDVGRHFFDKEQIKRVIDIMATYKMNRFHWHLTEDQGWRVEIKKYPKLTTVGSTRKYSQVWGHPEGVYYDYLPYGPYFYTQNDIKEVVAYARERFIEVIPEIDMPGHFQAALAAYPEYSCTPAKKIEVWTDYGVSYDVLNVANPQAMQFVKDILDELITLFPYRYIHIGGDECPTNAWQNNAECQALLSSLGSTNYRDLQTYFFKEIENHLKNKTNTDERRRVIAWNETLGGDLTGSDVTIMAWTGAAAASKTAAGKGLDVIITPQIPFYINRKQSADPAEPFSQGSGSETLEAVYNHEPVPSDATVAMLPYYKGVQACFWSEHVEHNWHLEYLMLPRIAAVAETGWSAKTAKNFNDFVQRIRKDSTLYNLKGWSYGKHYMQDKSKILPKSSTANDTHWFRIVTAATDAARAGKCIELISENSPLISSYSTAAINRLWTNTQAAENASNFEYQWWCLKESPTEKGTYAIVNRAVPGGSVNPAATAASNAGRWNYDPKTTYYSFVIGDKYFESGSAKYYSVRSKNYPALYMNFALSGQQFAVNLWGDPLDGNGGMMAFIPFLEAETEVIKALLKEMNLYLCFPVYEADGTRMPGNYSAEIAAEMRNVMINESEIYKLKNLSQFDSLRNLFTEKLNKLKNSVAYPEKDGLYYIESTKYGRARLVQTDNNILRYRNEASGDSAIWRVATTGVVTGSQARTLQLRNKATNLCIATGEPVELLSGVFLYKTEFNDIWQDFEISGYSVGNTARIFPMPEDALINAGTIGRNGIRPQGTGWRFIPAESPNAVKATMNGETRIIVNNKKIEVKNPTAPVRVFDITGCEIVYKMDVELKRGVYIVHSGNFSEKIIIN